MIDFIQWMVVAGLGAISSFATSAIFFRYNKKLKYVEANSSEFDYMKKQIEFLTKRIDELYTQLGKTEEARDNYMSALAESESKRYNLKGCVAAAHKCEYSHSCPVLIKEKENIEAWKESCIARGLTYNKKTKVFSGNINAGGSVIQDSSGDINLK